MSDITNYAYIWYKKDLTKLLEFTLEELEKIYTILIQFSYPCYLRNDMLDDDITKLLENELLFIQKKMIEYGLVDIIIMQIPRVLYDLFNIYYKKHKNLKLRFNYDCETSIDGDSIVKKRTHNLLTFRYTETVRVYI